MYLLNGKFEIKGVSFNKYSTPYKQKLIKLFTKILLEDEYKQNITQYLLSLYNDIAQAIKSKNIDSL